MMLGKKKVTGECFPCKIVFEKVILKSGFSRKFPYPPVEEDGIPGGGRKKTMVNYRGVVNVLMEFQGKKGKKKNNGKIQRGGERFDGIPGEEDIRRFGY